MWALIINNKVQEITDIDPAGRFHPEMNWQVCPVGVLQGWTFTGGTFAAPPDTGPTPSYEKLAAVQSKIDQLLNTGAPVAGGLHVALDDSSRADMSAMATTALAGSVGIPWPDSYKEGWISVENTRIALPTPTNGLTLAAGVGDYYAKVRQNGRTLKDAILAATDQSELDAIDVASGWPA